MQASGHAPGSPLRADSSAQLLHNLRSKVRALQTESSALKTPPGGGAAGLREPSAGSGKLQQRYTSTPDLTAVNSPYTEEVSVVQWVMWEKFLG